MAVGRQEDKILFEWHQVLGLWITPTTISYKPKTETWERTSVKGYVVWVCVNQIAWRLEGFKKGSNRMLQMESKLLCHIWRCVHQIFLDRPQNALSYLMSRTSQWHQRHRKTNIASFTRTQIFTGRKLAHNSCANYAPHLACASETERITRLINITSHITHIITHFINNTNAFLGYG